MPITLTLLGPSRYCLYPKILRSNNVIKATFNNTGNKIKKKLINLIIKKIILFK